jgi:diguanylate cyclase (GGDEF)-like protein
VEVAIAGYWLRGRHEFTVFVRDITLRREAEERLTRQALHDGLTGLPNRTLLRDRLVQAIAGARRAKERVSLLVLDLNGFKAVNDTFGHHAGDQVLQAVAIRFTAVLRAADTVARLGGDEFAIVLPATDDPSGVAAKLVDALEDPVIVDGQPLTVSVSIGVSRFPDDGAEPDALLRRADAGMYSAKRARQGAALAAETGR